MNMCYVPELTSKAWACFSCSTQDNFASSSMHSCVWWTGCTVFNVLIPQHARMRARAAQVALGAQYVSPTFLQENTNASSMEQLRPHAVKMFW